MPSCCVCKLTAPPRRHQCWWPSLLECGDIEANPGPRSRRSYNLSRCVAWNLNTNGSGNAWDFLEYAAKQKIDILTMQEIGMSDNEHLSFKRKAWNLGYTAIHSPGTCFNQGRGRHFWGGVVTVVSRKFRHAHAFSIPGQGGQAVACWIDGTLLVNVYVAHNDNRNEFLAELHSHFRNTAAKAQFLFVGDWNDEPCDNPLVSALSMYNGIVFSPTEATRWDGKRIIDYPITNLGHDSLKVSLKHEAFSDHKIVLLEVERPFSQQKQCILKPTLHIKVPSHLDPVMWSELLEKTWKAQEWQFQGAISSKAHCNQIWKCFIQAVERCLLDATRESEQCAPTSAHRPRLLCNQLHKKRSKGSTACFVTTAEPHRKHPEKHLPPSKIRQLRNVLARLREIRRSEMLGNCHPQRDWLLEKCRRVINLPDGPTENQISHINRLISQEQTSEKYRRIAEWKHELHSNSKAAYQWLRAGLEPVPTNLHCGETPAHSISECLLLLRDYWRSIWDRGRPNLEETIQQMTPLLGPRQRSTAWDPLTVKDIFAAASQQKGKSPGIDGFSGDEVAHLPFVFWQDALHIFQEFERTGYVPDAWTEIRQVHIPKPDKGKRSSDGATDVAALRPICILSVWFRIFASARWKSPSTQNWVSKWWPANAFGGRKNFSIMDALQHILNAAESDQYIAALDYSLAFDCTDPEIAMFVFQHKGMPPGWLGILESMWLHQKRTLQYAQECLPQQQHVSHSLPQGDPWSMAAMTAVLLVGIKAVQTEVPEATCITYVDDRTILAPTETSCLLACQVWKQWSRILGLTESESKEQFFHRKAANRKKFELAGIHPSKVMESPKILGTCLIGSTNRKLTPAETKRLQKACDTANKCACLPVPPEKRLRFVAATATPQASFGWSAKSPAIQDLSCFNKAVQRCVWRHQQADPSLARLLRGHFTDLKFTIACSEITNIFRAIKKGTFVPRRHRNGTGLHSLLTKYAKWLNWHPEAPWIFKTPSLDKVLYLSDVNMPNHAIKEIDELKHCLRESWRHQLFTKWSNRDRIDAKFCRDNSLDGNAIPYCPERCSIARRLAWQSGHTFAVMSGSFVSPCRFAVMSGLADDQDDDDDEFPGACPHCKAPADFQHWCWHCPALAHDVASLEGIPTDPLLFRMGWPDPAEKEKGKLILRHLAHRRKCAIDWRLANTAPT